MRLAVVSPFVDRRHGTERALAELLERLAEKYGCEIHLYAQKIEDLPVGDLLAASSAQPGAIFWRKVPSVPGPHIIQFTAWIFLNAFLRGWDALRGRASFDLVLSPGINCLHPDVVLVHALFLRLIEISRDGQRDPEARSGFLRGLHRRLYYALVGALERHTYINPRIALAAVSNRTAELLKRNFHRDDIYVIPNGVDASHFSPAARLARITSARERRGLRRDDFVLLLIGNDWRVKGLTTVLEAMSLLPEVPLRLLVVGTDSQGPFREIAARFGVDGQCLWETPQPDVLDFYAAADVYVSPSREDSFGLPVAEAMACGLPVITSAFAGVADCVRDGVDGFVLRDPRDAQALAQHVARLQKDVALRNSIGEAAAKAILAWTWDRNAAAVWQLLKETETRRSSRS